MCVLGGGCEGRRALRENSTPSDSELVAPGKVLVISVVLDYEVGRLRGVGGGSRDGCCRDTARWNRRNEDSVGNTKHLQSRVRNVATSSGE